MEDDNEPIGTIENFDSIHAEKLPENSAENSESPKRKIVSDPEKKVINYFAMNEDEIEKEKNKVREDTQDLFKDLDSNDRDKEVNDDNNGWEEEELDLNI